MVEVEMYEATPEMAKFVNSVVQKFIEESAKSDGKVNLTISMSFAVTLCAQVFLACGGDIEKGEQISDLVKMGMMSTLNAYKDLSRVTHLADRRLN